MATIPLVISVVSLLLSVTVAWLTLLRRGNLGMTQPMLIGFLHEAKQPKIFFRAMLYATGKRGHIVEALYLKVRHGESTQVFNFWMYGETKELKIGSGLRVGDDGVSLNHHFLPPKDASALYFRGDYAIETYVRILNRNAGTAVHREALSFSGVCTALPTTQMACFSPGVQIHRVITAMYQSPRRGRAFTVCFGRGRGKLPWA